MAILEIMKVPVADAKNKLPALIKAVENGESVTICRRGVPVVDLVRTKKPGRARAKFGTLKGRVRVRDSGWWKPLAEEEANAFLDGRF